MKVVKVNALEVVDRAQRQCDSRGVAARKDMGKGAKPRKETPAEKSARVAAEILERNAQHRKKLGQPPKLKTLISDRILWALDKIKVTGVDASIKAGRTRSHINSITNGTFRDPEVGVIASLHKHVLSAFSLEWLITGNGVPMAIGLPKQTLPLTAALEKASNTPYLVVAAASAMAGALREERDEATWSVILTMLGRAARVAREPQAFQGPLLQVLAEHPEASEAVTEALLAFCLAERDELSAEGWRLVRSEFEEAEKAALAIAEAARRGKETTGFESRLDTRVEKRGAPPAEKSSKKSRS